MPAYDPITNVMPVASMVTNAVVGAALCDQIRDNLVALYDGWWFRATRTTAASMSATTVTAIPMDVLTKSATATAEGSIGFAGNGAVSITKTGVWMVGFHFMVSAYVGTLEGLIDATDAVGPYLCERLVDANATTTDFCMSAVVNLTSATNTLVPYIYAGTSTSTDTTRPPTMWAVRLGDSP